MTLDVLVAEQPRIAARGFAPGSFAARGPLLVLVGEWSPLFELLARRERLDGGSLAIAGADVAVAVRQGRVALMLADSPWPEAWSLREVLMESAGLLGLTRRQAARAVSEHARELGLLELLAQRVSRSSPAELRAAAILAAVLGDPPLIAIDRPFAELAPSACAYVRGVLERAVRGRAALISVPRVPDSPEVDEFLRSASELLLLGSNGLAARGSHAELVAGATTYRVVVLRCVEALLERLAATGYQARAVLGSPLASLVISDPNGLGTAPLFAAALEADAPLIELVPLVAHQTAPVAPAAS